MVTIYDTYPQMTSLAGAPFGLGAWRRYAEGIYPAHPGTESFREKIEADVRGYDFEAQIRPVWKRRLPNRRSSKPRMLRFCRLPRGLRKNLRRCCPACRMWTLCFT